MQKLIGIICCTVLALGFHMQVRAQVSEWPTPEAEQMYRQAKEYLSKGGVQQAIVLYRQALQLAPDMVLLYRDLAQALNLAGSYNEAYETIAPILASKRADEHIYQIAAIALAGKGERKKARKLLEKGIAQFPHSGLLYYELGKSYEAIGDKEYALDSWLQGIENDPGYHLNYYEAAKMYAEAGQPIWVLLYGEIFVNLEQYTTRSVEMRKLILTSYENLYRNTSSLPIPKYGQQSVGAEIAKDFETAVRQIMLQLAPVVSDGITVENLTMLRTRFVMEWQTTYAARFPFTLFIYHDKMLRTGHFDAYNQWLLGQVHNIHEFNAWTEFHSKAIPDYENWALQNPFYPTAADAYNKRELGKLFKKRR